MRQCEKNTQTQPSDTQFAETSLSERMTRIGYEVALEEIVKFCDQHGDIADMNPKAFVRIVRSLAYIGLKGSKNETQGK